MTRHKIKAYAARAGRYGTHHHLVIATLVFAALGSWFSYQSLRYQQQAVAEADFDIEPENFEENLARFEKMDDRTLAVFLPFGESHSLYLKITNLGQLAARKTILLIEATEPFEEFGMPIRSLGPPFRMEELGQRRFRYEMDWFLPKQIEYFQLWFDIREATPDGAPEIKVTVGAENLDKFSEHRFVFKQKSE